MLSEHSEVYDKDDDYEDEDEDMRDRRMATKSLCLASLREDITINNRQAVADYFASAYFHLRL